MEVVKTPTNFFENRTMGADDIKDTIKRAVRDMRPAATPHVPAQWLLVVSVVAIVSVAATAIAALATRG